MTAQVRRLDGVRAAVLNWRDPWQVAAGGAEVFAVEISRGLIAAGASIDFYTSREPGQPRVELRDGIRWFRRGGRWTVYPAALGMLIARRLRRTHYDVVLDCQNGIPFFTPLAVARRRTAVIIVVHHVHDEQFGAHFSRSLAALGRWLEGPASRRLYRHSTAVAVSPSTVTAIRDRLRWLGPIELVHNGARPPPTTADAASRSVAPRIVVVGRLVRHKRLERVVRLVDELAEHWPTLEVHIVGRGPDEGRIRAAISRLRNPARVTVHGYLDAPVKDALLRTAWLHISASQGEGWGLSVLEAAAMGIPSVAYDVDGLRDAIRDGEIGWLVGPSETLPVTVDRALREIDRDSERAESIRKACVSWAGQFEWATSTARIVSLVQAELKSLRTGRDTKHDDAVGCHELPDDRDTHDPASPARVVAREH